MHVVSSFSLRELCCPPKIEATSVKANQTRAFRRREQKYKNGKSASALAKKAPSPSMSHPALFGGKSRDVIISNPNQAVTTAPLPAAPLPPLLVRVSRDPNNTLLRRWYKRDGQWCHSLALLLTGVGGGGGSTLDPGSTARPLQSSTTYASPERMDDSSRTHMWHAESNSTTSTARWRLVTAHKSRLVAPSGDEPRMVVPGHKLQLLITTPCRRLCRKIVDQFLPTKQTTLDSQA